MLLQILSFIPFNDFETKSPKAGINFIMMIVIIAIAITNITKFIIVISKPFIQDLPKIVFLIFFSQLNKIKLWQAIPTR